MKKYIKPTTDIIYIETQQMIAESLTLTKDTDPETPPINNNNEVLSRGGRGFWDDEDEY